MRIKNLPILLFLFFLSGHLGATHIVGGEFELLFQKNYIYTLSLKLYFDEVNGDPAILTNAADQSVMVYVFRKKDNSFVQSFSLPKVSTRNVDYTNPACGIGALRTLILLYKADINLSPSQYSDPEGYYVAWERCCRNNTISNIQYPNSTGQTFYLEFPPVTKDGRPFVNSSPSLFPPLNDYACINRPFYFDFGGEDLDKDSLVYSLVTPFAGNSSIFEPLPLPSSAPYTPVSWENGIGPTNMIPGNPSLKIDSRTGFLFVQPAKLGLYVFSVKCDEYRKGKKIGEVRRDFQLMVIDCPQNDPPKITVVPPKGKQFVGKQDTVDFVLGEEKCFNFRVTDPQIPTKLTVDVKALNFDPTFLTPSHSKQLNSKGDALVFDICFPDCPNKKLEPYVVQIISRDDGCSLPLLDTAILVINVLPPPNLPATIKTDLASNDLVSKVGNTIKFNLLSNDPDGKAIKISAVPIGFKFEDVEMRFDEIEGVGPLSLPFSWTTSCNFLNLNEKDEYEIDFIVEELVPCPGIFFDTVRVKMKLETDPNSPPVVSIDQTITDPVIVYVGQQLSWNVIASDSDNHLIYLKGTGRNFNLDSVGAVFENRQGNGSVVSPFTWSVTCDHVLDSLYTIDFIAQDKNCYDPEYDSITVTILVKDNEQGSQKFLPPNVITPNGDGKNEAFTLENISSSFETPTTFNLPKDVCGNRFEEIVIVNRWGNVVYKDNKRDFVWSGKGISNGTYYYSIKYTKTLYKGTISVMY